MPDASTLAALPWLLFGFAITEAALLGFYLRRPAWRRHKMGTRPAKAAYLLEVVVTLALAFAAYLLTAGPEAIAFAFGLAAPAVAGGALALLRANEDARTIGYLQGLEQGMEVVDELREDLGELPQVRRGVEALLDQAAAGLEKAREEARRHLEES